MQDLVAALEPLFGNRVFPGIAPLKTALPFLTYTHIGGEIIYTFCGPADQRNYVIQFNVWSLRQLEARERMEAARGILIAPPFRAYPTGEMVDVYDDSTRQHGARQDFSLWKT